MQETYDRSELAANQAYLKHLAAVVDKIPPAREFDDPSQTQEDQIRYHQAYETAVSGAAPEGQAAGDAAFVASVNESLPGLSDWISPISAVLLAEVMADRFSQETAIAAQAG